MGVMRQTKSVKAILKVFEAASTAIRTTDAAAGLSACLPLEIKIPSLPDYQIDSAELLLTGTCDNCK